MNSQTKSAMGRFKLILLSLILSLSSVGQMINIPAKPEPAVYVNDFGGAFSESQRADLEQMLKTYYDTTSTQIVIVSLKSLEGAEASDYATELGEKWGIGKKDKDNGVVFLFVPTERKMFIASGYGVEHKLTDVFLTRIRENFIKPEFKKGDYYSGVRLGIQLMMQRLSGEYKADPTQNQPEQIELTTEDIIIMIIVFFIFLWIISKISKAVNYSETYSGGGYRGGLGGGLGGGFWGSGGSGGWSGGGGGWSSGGSFGGGSFGGGGSGGDW